MNNTYRLLVRLVFGVLLTLMLGSLAVSASASPMSREICQGFSFGDQIKSQVQNKPAQSGLISSSLPLWLERDLNTELTPKPTEVDLRDFIHFDMGDVSDVTLFEGFRWHPGDSTWRLKGATISMKYEPRERPTFLGAPYALIRATLFEPINSILERF